MTGRYHVNRKAYKKSRVKKLLARFYKRVQTNPVVLARYDMVKNEWIIT